MSAREAFPKARLPQSHFFVTFARGDNARCFAIRPWALFSIGALFPLGALVYFSATLLFVMRDDMLAALMQRQSAMQVAYEDRLAALRMQLDRVTSSQLLDQNSLEARMHELLSRQARLESRAALIATLADGAGLTTAAKSAPTNAQLPAIAQPLPARTERETAPSSVLGYAPSGGPLLAPPSLRAMPRPGPVEIQSGDQPAGRPVHDRARQGAFLFDPRAAAIAADAGLPPEVRLGALTQSLDQIEATQLRTVNVIAGHARQTEAQLKQIIAATGLPAEKMQPPTSAAGGPFVPFKLDGAHSPFEREVLRMQNHVANADRLRRIAMRLPLRKPLSGDPQITSGYGARIDPFNGRLASHTGIDFRQAWGSPVRATAAGVVIFAGANGGYGNMVDIDHGNGVVSRYAHLSAIVVKAGQSIASGAVLGRLGSTGRSTGPHLHYEVRYNDQPLDPRRFLSAGLQLAGR